MPHFSESGHDLVICQVCGRDIDTGKETPVWRPIPGRKNNSSGNVCAQCVARISNPLLALQLTASAAARETYGTPPVADTYDPVRLPWAISPRGNKLGLSICATCGKPPTETHRNDLPTHVFMFRDELSAREYRISGMCQACQDDVFRESDEDEEGE